MIDLDPFGDSHEPFKPLLSLFGLRKSLRVDARFWLKGSYGWDKPKIELGSTSLSQSLLQLYVSNWAEEFLFSAASGFQTYRSGVSIINHIYEWKY